MFWRKQTKQITDPMKTQLDAAPKVIYIVNIYELTQKDLKNINKIRYVYKFLTDSYSGSIKMSI